MIRENEEDMRRKRWIREKGTEEEFYWEVGRKQGGRVEQKKERRDQGWKNRGRKEFRMNDGMSSGVKG